MANTTITITLGDESLIADVTSVAVVSGDTIAFQNNVSYAVRVYANSGATSILAPAIGSDGVEIASGGSSSFGFTSGSSGNYVVLIQGAKMAPPGPENPPTNPPNATLAISTSKTGWPSDGGQDMGKPGGGG